MTKEKFVTVIRAWLKYIEISDKIGEILGCNLIDSKVDNVLNIVFENHFSDYSNEAQDMITDFIYEHCITKDGVDVDNPVPMKLYDSEIKEEVCSIDSLEDLYDYIQANFD